MLVLAKREHGWAIVDAATGQLAVIDGHLPIFWFRRVAVAVAGESGFVTSGRGQNVRVCRVDIQQSKVTR